MLINIARMAGFKPVLSRFISRVLKSQLTLMVLGVVQVQVCTDGREADFVDSKTGESIANPTRPRFLLWDMQVVKPATVWLIGDATNEVVGGC